MGRLGRGWILILLLLAPAGAVKFTVTDTLKPTSRDPEDTVVVNAVGKTFGLSVDGKIKVVTPDTAAGEPQMIGALNGNMAEFSPIDTFSKYYPEYDKSVGAYTIQDSIIQHGDGSISVDSCSVYLRDNPNHDGGIRLYHIVAAGPFVLTDGELQYIAAHYNGGNPEFTLLTNPNSGNSSDTTIIWAVVRQGNYVHSMPADNPGKGLSNKLNKMLQVTEPYRLTYGDNTSLICSETSIPNNRTIVVAEGSIWTMNFPMHIGAFNSSVDSLTFMYHSVGVWRSSRELSYDSLRYDDGTDLVVAGNNKWLKYWHFRSIGDVVEVFTVCGNQEYDKEYEADTATIPELPDVIRWHCILVGSSVIEKGSSVGKTIALIGCKTATGGSIMSDSVRASFISDTSKSAGQASNSDSLGGYTIDSIKTLISFALDSSKSSVYGSIHSHDESHVLSVATTYTKVNSFDREGRALGAIIDTTNDWIILNRNGMYYAEGHASFSPQTAGVEFKPVLFLNEDELDETHDDQKYNTASSKSGMTVSGHVWVSDAPDTLTMRVRKDGVSSQNITITYSHLLAHGISNSDTMLYADTADYVRNSPTVVVGGTGITVTQSNDTFTVSEYQPPNIDTYTNTEASNYAGQTVTGLTTNWTLSGADITAQTHTDVSPDPDVADRSYVFTGLSLTTDKTYKLRVTDGTTPDSAYTYVRFYIATFYGVTSSSPPTEADVEAGTTTWEIQTASNRVLPATIITGGGDYVFYAYPESWGDVQIYVNGFSSTWIKTTVSVTNAYGDTRNYFVYTSPTTIVGSITLSATGI